MCIRDRYTGRAFLSVGDRFCSQQCAFERFLAFDIWFRSAFSDRNADARTRDVGVRSRRDPALLVHLLDLRIGEDRNVKITGFNLLLLTRIYLIADHNFMSRDALKLRHKLVERRLNARDAQNLDLGCPCRLSKAENERRRGSAPKPVSYTHLRAHETVLDLVCR